METGPASIRVEPVRKVKPVEQLDTDLLSVHKLDDAMLSKILKAAQATRAKVQIGIDHTLMPADADHNTAWVEKSFASIRPKGEFSTDFTLFALELEELANE